MQSQVDEIAAGIYRISTLVPEAAPGGFSFNQFLVDADEPLLFHCGMRQLFPLVTAAVEQVMPVSRLRWLSFAHVEADECGSMNDWLAAAPDARVVHGIMGVLVSVNDLADRPPVALADGEVLELGAYQGEPRRVRGIPTPHVPHNWESHILYEEVTGTLFCGDLLSQAGETPAITADDLLPAAVLTEQIFSSSSLGPAIPATLRRLADLEPTPKTLAIMHGASYNGDCPGLLRSAAEAYEQDFGCLAAAGA
jgi:flavorubredoxin